MHSNSSEMRWDQPAFPPCPNEALPSSVEPPSIPDVDPDSVEIGRRVQVGFAELPGQGQMPRFRLVDQS